MLSISLKISGLQEAADQIISRFKARAKRGTEILWEQLYTEIQTNLSNNILNIRSGELIGSLEYSSYVESKDSVIQAFAGTNTRYAAYQEFGYEGVQSLRNGGSRYTSYSGRPYIRPALGEIAKNVIAVLATELRNGD